MMAAYDNKLSIRHHKKYQKNQNVNGNPVSHFCVICNVGGIKSIDDWKHHIESMNHRCNLYQFRELRAVQKKALKGIRSSNKDYSDGESTSCDSISDQVNNTDNQSDAISSKSIYTKVTEAKSEETLPSVSRQKRPMVQSTETCAGLNKRASRISKEEADGHHKDAAIRSPPLGDWTGSKDALVKIRATWQISKKLRTLKSREAAICSYIRTLNLMLDRIKEKKLSLKRQKSEILHGLYVTNSDSDSDYSVTSYPPCQTVLSQSVQDAATDDPQENVLTVDETIPAQPQEEVRTLVDDKSHPVKSKRRFTYRKGKDIFKHPIPNHPIHAVLDVQKLQRIRKALQSTKSLAYTFEDVDQMF